MAINIDRPVTLKATADNLSSSDRAKYVGAKGSVTWVGGVVPEHAGAVGAGPARCRPAHA